MEQQPIFIPLENIETFPEAATDPEDSGHIELTGKEGILRGFRCKDITAEYSWNPNGALKGYCQTLMCRFSGSEPNFNYMARIMGNCEIRYILLLPRDNKPYVIVGNKYDGLDFAIRTVEHQTWAMECPYWLVPFPYYDGPVEVTDCTGPELMEHLYGVKLKRKEK